MGIHVQGRRVHARSHYMSGYVELEYMKKLADVPIKTGSNS
jgi:hypothetical protein